LVKLKEELRGLRWGSVRSSTALLGVLLWIELYGGVFHHFRACKKTFFIHASKRNAYYIFVKKGETQIFKYLIAKAF
jgi:hypothetical protein